MYPFGVLKWMWPDVLDVDSTAIAYWLIALVIGVIVLEEMLRRFGVRFKHKTQQD